MIRRLVFAALAMVAFATASPADAQYVAQHTTVVASAAKTAGGTSAPISVGFYREYSLFCNVSAESGTASPTLTLFVDAFDGASWYQIASGSAITGVGSQVIGIGAGVGTSPVTFGDVIRVRWSITGTTPSFTFSVVGIGK